MNWKRANIAVHRDLGYFFCFMTIIYGISGIALNHASDWNPDFVIDRNKIEMKLPSEKKDINKEIVLQELKRLDESDGFLMFDFPSSKKMKLYFKNGSMLYDLEKGTGEIERIKRRPIFNEVNFMHRNPGMLWTWFSDIFAFSLIVLSITGLFILNGKKSIKARGKWISLSGAGISLILMFFIIN